MKETEIEKDRQRDSGQLPGPFCYSVKTAIQMKYTLPFLLEKKLDLNVYTFFITIQFTLCTVLDQSGTVFALGTTFSQL